MNIDSARWPEFSALLDRMLDQPQAQRAAWVRALQGADASFAPQLLELLRKGQDGRATAWLDTLPKLSQFEGPPPDPGQMPERPGDEIGPYRLVRLLGSGGMASVWYAERSDQLMRRAVALKLPLAVAGRGLAARFERERAILASLTHPHIARLYDAGVTADGRGYLALEYVEGQELDRYCDAHRLGIAARVDLFLQVLGAVQYAHSRLVVHRDLKPSNILVTAEGYVRLLDFGVAKLLAEEAGGDLELTRAGAAAMTLAYAAPEQVAGQPVSTATDVYALAVVLYELLTGTRPYRLRRGTRGAMEDAILAADIPLPSTVAIDAEAAAARAAPPARLQRELRGDLDAILIKALQRDPAQRYATVDAFAEDLRRYRRGAAVRAHRPSRWYRARKFVVRNRLVAASVAAVMSALLAGAGVALWQAREARHQALIAAAERDNALAAAEHREAVDAFLSDLLLEAGRSGEAISIASLIARADELSSREFADNPEARAAVLRTVGEFEAQFQETERALRAFQDAGRLLAGSRDEALRASVVCGEATLRAVAGEAAQAEAVFRRVLEDPQTTADIRIECYGDQAEAALYRSDGALAASAVHEALDLLAAQPHASVLKALELRILQARADALLGQPARAETAFAQIMVELQRLGRDRGTWGDVARWGRIDAAIASGDLLVALAQIDAAIDIDAQGVPEKAPILLLYDRAVVLAALARHKQALAQFRAVAELAAAKEPEFYRRARLNAAVVCAKLGRFDAAEREYQLATQHAGGMRAGSPGEVSQLMARARVDLAHQSYSAARRGLSEAMGKPAAAAYLPDLQQYRAEAELGAADLAAAESDARAVVAVLGKQAGAGVSSYWLGYAELVLGKVLLAAGRGAEARTHLEQAVRELGGSTDASHPALLDARNRLKQFQASG